MLHTNIVRLLLHHNTPSQDSSQLAHCTDTCMSHQYAGNARIPYGKMSIFPVETAEAHLNTLSFADARTQPQDEHSHSFPVQHRATAVQKGNLDDVSAATVLSMPALSSGLRHAVHLHQQTQKQGVPGQDLLPPCEKPGSVWWG